MSEIDLFSNLPSLQFLHDHQDQDEILSKIPNFVAEELAKDEMISDEKLESLFKYFIPLDLGDGSCSASKELQKEPFDLGAELFGTLEWKSIAPQHLITKRIFHLDNIVNQISKTISLDWLGIYKKIEIEGKEPYLLKLAYFGKPSRPKFPLNETWKEFSNNTCVGMEGIPRLVQNVSSYEGPYYSCDGLVQSEFCVPIFDSEKKQVIGIVDAESFQKNYFTPENAFHILKLCSDLGFYEALDFEN